MTGAVSRAVKDHYQALGVARDSSDQQIKDRFRELARALHPDANPQDAHAVERFKEIAEAWDVLSNRERRQQHDQALRRQEWSRRAQEDHLLDGLLDGLFGAREPDGEATITLAQALDGTEVTADMPGGTHARGWAAPGTWDGAVIRAQQHGSSQQARIRIRVQPHPLFSISEEGVHAELSLSLAEAALGTDLQAVAPRGPFRLRVPAGTHHGQVLRLAGLVDAGDRTLDLLLTVNVRMPAHLGSGAQELLRRFDQACPPVAWQHRQEAMRILQQDIDQGT